jgi:hypothetical protein
LSDAGFEVGSAFGEQVGDAHGFLGTLVVG